VLGCPPALLQKRLRLRHINATGAPVNTYTIATPALLERPGSGLLLDQVTIVSSTQPAPTASTLQ
jgi:hypothetical protein